MMAVDILERLSRACGYGDIGEAAFNVSSYTDGLKVLAFWFTSPDRYMRSAMLIKEDGSFMCGASYEDIAKSMYVCFNAG